MEVWSQAVRDKYVDAISVQVGSGRKFSDPSYDPNVASNSK